MKILHTMAGGVAGGAEMAYVDMVIAQHQSGMEVIAACRPNDQRTALLNEAGVAVVHFPFGGIFDFQTTKGLRQLMKAEQPDIVQCWMSRAAKLTPKVQGIPKIARLGGYYNLKYYRDVDHFIGNTPDICRWLIEEQSIEENRVTHINNFAELDPIESPLSKKDFETKEDDFAFLLMARLHQVKGVDTALRALALVPEAVLWIAGDGAEEKSLKRLAHQLGVQDRVRWLGWRTDRSAMLDACDAVLFPSRFEPFGGTFAQAWAARKSLVTTASQGPMQYVTDGHDALVAPIDDHDRVAEQMTRIMNDQFLRRSLIREGYDAFTHHFTRKKVIKDYEDLYHSLTIKDGES